MWSPSRPTNNPPQPPVQELKDPPPHSTPAPTASNPRRQEPITYIGKSLLIRGEMSGSEPIHIEGRVEGPISLCDCRLNIGRDGVVISDVQAGEVIVRGTLQGNLTASDRVDIHCGGSLKGDVAAGRVSIEYGAYFQGSIDMRLPDTKAHFKTDSQNGKAKKRPSEQDESEQSPVLAALSPL